MSTLKKTAKTKSVYKPLPLNKKNAVAFADRLFSDSKGEVKFLKLCDGTLAGAKVGTKQLHCAVGEVHFQFVNPRMPTASSQGDATELAILNIVKVAQLKAPVEANQVMLESALQACVEENDSIEQFELDSAGAEYLERAQAVARIWREQIVPLLK